MVDSNIQRYNPPIETGLINEQVEERKINNLTNKVMDCNKKTNRQIIKENLLTYFNIIFFSFKYFSDSYRLL